VWAYALAWFFVNDRVKIIVYRIFDRKHSGLQLATELDFLYNKGNFDEKRLLCETVIKRLNVENGTIVNMELNSPFALIAGRSDGSESICNGGPLWTRTTDPGLIRTVL
jgi:hypothetical protein